MSRIGKIPVELPEKVKVELLDGNLIKVTGPKGTLTQDYKPEIKIEVKDNQVTFIRETESKKVRALHGLYRNLVNNMVIGVNKGYEKKLEIVGVGYRSKMDGTKLVLQIGYSKNVIIEPVEGISFECPSQTVVLVKGINKQQVGQIAADIRKLRPPEPYKGKGIRYSGEYIMRKEGKKGL